MSYPIISWNVDNMRFRTLLFRISMKLCLMCCTVRQKQKVTLLFQWSWILYFAIAQGVRDEQSNIFYIRWVFRLADRSRNYIWPLRHSKWGGARCITFVWTKTNCDTKIEWSSRSRLRERFCWWTWLEQSWTTYGEQKARHGNLNTGIVSNQLFDACKAQVCKEFWHWTLAILCVTSSLPKHYI